MAEEIYIRYWNAPRPYVLESVWKLFVVWNVMAHAQKPDFAFRRNGRVHLNCRRRQFSQLLAADVCTSALVMLDTPRSKVVWRVLATHSIRQFPPHFPCVTVCHQVSKPLYIHYLCRSFLKFQFWYLILRRSGEDYIERTFMIWIHQILFGWTNQNWDGGGGDM